MPSVDHRDGSVDNFVPRHKVIHRGALKRLLLATVFSALACGQVFAADAPQKISASKQKSQGRTIKQMIELAMTKGGDDPLRGNADLGVPASQSKLVSYSEKKTPDHRGHDFTVILDAKGKPAELLWLNVAYSTDGSVKQVDGWEFRSSLTGRLIAAAHSFGPSGKTTREKASADSASVKAAFDKERDYTLRVCKDLPFETE